MTHSELLKQIDSFVELVREFSPDLQVSHLSSKEYFVKKHWEEDPPPFFRNTGIYFLLSKGEEILLIGKSEDKIGGRACDHIKKLSEGRFHIKEGTNRPIDQKLSSEIAEGNFYISGSVIDPSYLSCLVEVFGLSICNREDGFLPIFNQKYC